jgi:hypothetical protein
MAREPGVAGSNHWLTRPVTIRLLWRVATIVLALLVAIDLGTEKHPHFGIDGLPGFSAWFGFAACVVLVLASKVIGMVLKRPDSYYED